MKKPVGLINIFISTYSHTKIVQIAKYQRIGHLFLKLQHFRSPFELVTQKLRNSNLLFHNTKNPIKLNFFKKSSAVQKTY